MRYTHSMKLFDFLFGRGTSEGQKERVPEEHAQYGQLAEREKLAEALRTRNVAEEAAGEAEREGRPPRLFGFERTAGRLAERVRKEQLPRWHKISGKLGKLERKLADAESEDDIRKIAKRATSPHGLFRKIERGMKKRLVHLEEEGASRGEIRRYERDLRKLERRLERPTRFLR